MEKSVIELYLWPDGKTLSGLERYPSRLFDSEDVDAILRTPLAELLLREVDKSTYVGNNTIMNDVLGCQPAEYISGGVKTILLAAHYRDLKFPINNCGDNCANGIYEASKGKPTKWYWLGYLPKLCDNQLIALPELGLQTKGAEVDSFMMHGIPEEFTALGRARRNRER